MRAEVREARAVGQLVDDQFLGRGREHDLPPVRQVPQARSAVDRRPYVVAFVAQPHFAGVNADT